MVQVPKIMESWEEAEALIKRLAKQVLREADHLWATQHTKTMAQCERQACDDLVLGAWKQGELQDADAFGIAYCWPGRGDGVVTTGDELGLRMSKVMCEDEVTRTMHELAYRIIRYEVEHYLLPEARDLYPKHLVVKKLG